VSALATEVDGEIGYSAGTARRELLRHVRELQPSPSGEHPAAEDAADPCVDESQEEVNEDD